MNDKERLIEKMYIKLDEAIIENNIQARVIKGEGAVFSKIALVGEAPGGEEEKKGRPFVGSAGKNLDKFLETLGISRDSVYVTNVVKWRPKTISQKSGRFINRTPVKSEIELCSPFLFEELKIIEPQIVVTLGNVALKAVTGDSSIKIGEFHGRRLSLSGLEIFPLYHPASVIYNRELYDVYESDLQILKTIINM